MKGKLVFTTKEKVILVILALILLGFAYYQFVHKPITEGLEKAASERSTLEVELNNVNAKIATLKRMEKEIDDIIASGDNSYMASYNNSKAELKLLNDLLQSAPQYSVSFSNVTRDDDQIRRNFSLQFTAPDYDTMQSIIETLTGVEYRCLIGNMSCSLNKIRYRDITEYGDLSISVTATFFETMVGGTEDSGLPVAN